MKKFLLLMLLFPALAFGQAVRYGSSVVDQSGHPLPNVFVAICTEPAVTGTQPCSPLATLYTDSTGATTASNPLQTDSHGNYSFYAAPGVYTIQYYGGGLSNPVIESDTQVPSAVALTTVANLHFFTKVGLATVTDGTSSGDCTVGGGTYTVTCDYDGSVWNNIGGSASMVYPALGIAVSTGTGWNSSFSIPSGAKPAFAAFSSDAIQYVSASGNDSNDGLSWGAAKATIGAAVSALPTAGGRIFVGAGTFTPASSVTVTNPNVQIIGQGEWVTTIDCTITDCLKFDMSAIAATATDNAGGLFNLSVEANDSANQILVHTLDFTEGFHMVDVNLVQPTHAAGAGVGLVCWEAENTGSLGTTQTERSFLQHVWFGYCDVGIKGIDSHTGGGSNSFAHSFWNDVRWNMASSQTAIELDNDMSLDDSYISGTVNPDGGATGITLFDLTGTSDSYTVSTQIYVDGSGTGVANANVASGATLTVTGVMGPYATTSCSGTCRLPPSTGFSAAGQIETSNEFNIGTSANGYARIIPSSGTTYLESSTNQTTAGSVQPFAVTGYGATPVLGTFATTGLSVPGLTINTMTGTKCLHEVSGVIGVTSADCGTGSGGVTSLSGDGALITNSLSTGAVTLTLGNAAAYGVWGNITASSATPAYHALSTFPAAAFPTLNQNTTGTSAGLTSYPTLCTGGQFSQGLSSGSNNCATPSTVGTVTDGAGTTTADQVATSTTTLHQIQYGTSLTGITLDGVSPTTMGYLDATSSIQTQLDSKAGKSLVQTYSANQTLSCASNGGNEIDMNGTNLTVTLDASPTSNCSYLIKNLNSTDLTVALNGNTYNGGSSAVTLTQNQSAYMTWSSTTWSGSTPLLAGSNITLTPSSNGLTIAAAGSSTPREFTFMMGSDGGPVLVDTDDQNGIWVNRTGTTIHITEVWCQSDAGSPTVNIQNDNGTATNVLSTDLTCATGAGASSTSFVSGEDAVANGSWINFLTQTAGGTAKRVTINVLYTPY